MLNAINGIIAGAQPVVALILILAGLFMVVLSWGGYITTNRSSIQTWMAIYAAILTGLILIMSGFYIAHW